jgi:stearoyl-CoA desaturase (delta-9 desaturase)
MPGAALLKKPIDLADIAEDAEAAVNQPAAGPNDVWIDTRIHPAHAIGMALAIALPFLAFLAAIVLLWNRAVGWTDLALLAALYFPAALGITIGYHRMLTHRAFEPVPALKVALLAAGAIAIQGRPIKWAIDHRIHHARSDQAGDPHSPVHGFGTGVWQTFLGFLHAHMGWMFTRVGYGSDKWARDLWADPIVSFMDRSYWWWASLALALPAGLGLALTGTAWGMFTGLLWGGFVRVFFVHHITWSINSICHMYGTRPFVCHDRSANNRWLAIPSFGESWHHNHHVFPAAAIQGVDRGQVDLSGMLITLWERLGWVRNVRRATEEQKARLRRPGRTS